MIPDCDGRSDGRSDGQTDGRTESIMAKTALCIASYADALSKNSEKNFLGGAQKFTADLERNAPHSPAP